MYKAIIKIYHSLTVILLLVYLFYLMMPHYLH